MNEDGYSLVEVLISIALLGLIFVVIFPIISNANNNFKRSRARMHMGLLAETIIENIKAFEYSKPNKYILDMTLDELLNLMEEDENIIINLPYDEKIDYPYSVSLIKKEISENMWKIIVKVIEDEIEQEISLKTYVYRPVVAYEK